MNAPDDRVLPLTRAVAAGIVPVLTAAFVILYVFPGRTTQLWSWTIASEMTAMFIGGGYIAGAYFFVRVVKARQWHRVSVGFVAITAFATILGITTFLHWDKFNHDHVSFWAWTALYVITPVLLPVLWLRNQRQDPRTPVPGTTLVPAWLRTVLIVAGAGQLLVAFAMFVRPSLFLDSWPWPLTPLTARVISAFIVFPSLSYLAAAFERRWDALEVPIETAMIAMFLYIPAGIRGADEFRGSDFIVWGWRVGLVVGLGLLLALRLSMARRRPAAPA